MKRYVKSSKTISISPTDMDNLEGMMSEIYHNYGYHNYGNEDMSMSQVVSMFVEHIEEVYPDMDISKTDLRRIGKELYNQYF